TYNLSAIYDNKQQRSCPLKELLLLSVCSLHKHSFRSPLTTLTSITLMFTRRRKSSSDASLMSPKRIRVNEASEDGTYPPCLPSIPSTFTPLPLTPGPPDDNLTDPEYLSSYNADNTFTKSDTIA